MTSFIDGLTDEQRKTIEEYSGGPMRILAIPGSGKTKTMVSMAAHLWETFPSRTKRKPRVRMVTFTTKARTEAKERLIALTGGKAANSVTTFHQLASQIYRAHPDPSHWWPGNCEYITDPIDRKIFKSLSNILDLDISRDDLNDIWNSVVHRATCLEEIEDSFILSDGKEEGVIRMMLDTYKRQKLIPLDLLVPIAVSILRRRDRGICEFLIVDEFQDSDTAQIHLCTELIKPYNNIIVVGDIHQSIYQWRGACPENIGETFVEMFPDQVRYNLTLNFRSTPVIMSAAAGVLSQFYEEDFPHRTNSVDCSHPIEITYPDGPYEEASDVVDWVIKKINSGISPNEIIVLFRLNSCQVILEKEFIKKGVPYRIHKGGSFFQRKEVADIMAYMKWSLDPNDRKSAERAINRPRRGVGSATLRKINTNYLEAGRWTSRSDSLRVLLKRMHSNLSNMPITEWLSSIIHNTGLSEMYKDDERRISSFSTLMNWAAEYEQDEISHSEFIDEIMLSSPEDDSSDKEAVRLMTMHASKGLEAECVVIVHAVEGVIPFGFGDMQEECHLMYVAISRAKKHLLISCPDMVYRFSSPMYTSPSSFIKHISTDNFGDKVKYI